MTVPSIGIMRAESVFKKITTNYFLNGFAILSQVAGSDQMDFLYDETCLAFPSMAKNITTYGTFKVMLLKFLTTVEIKW